MQQTNVTRVLDEVRKLTPQDIEDAIAFCQATIKSIEERAAKEIDAEKQQIQRLKKLGRAFGVKPAGAAAASGERKILREEIAKAVKVHGPRKPAAIAEELNVPLRAVQVAVARSKGVLRLDAAGRVVVA